MTTRRPSSPANASLRSRVAIVAVVLLGFALRLYQLGAPSLDLAELALVSPALQGLWAAITSAPTLRGAGLLDAVLTWAALQCAQADFVARLPAAFIGALTVALLYRLGATTINRPTGALAALLLALAPLHLRASQTAAHYALLTGLAVASTLALIVALRRNRRRDWTVYAALLAAALSSHIAAAMLVTPQGLVVLLYPWRAAGSHRPAAVRRRFLLSVVSAVVLVLPWWLFSVPWLANPLPIAGAALVPGSASAWWTRWITGGANAGRPALLPWLYAALALVGLVGGLRQPPWRLPTLLIGLPLAAAPVFVVWAQQRTGASAAVQQTSFLLPFILLLVSLGATRVARLAGEALDRRSLAGARFAEGVITLVLALTLVVPLWPATVQALRAERPDWRNALAFIAANVGPDDAVVAPGVPGVTLHRYWPEYARWLRHARSTAEVQMVGQTAPAVWVVISREARNSAPGLRAMLRAAGALMLDWGPELAVYYWQPGRSLNDAFAASLRWTPPRNPAVLERLAYIYADANMPDAAASTARQAAALAGTRQAASRFEELRGSIWRRFGDREQAIAAYQQALMLWPDNHEALVRLGEQLLMRNRVDEAAVYLERAARLDPASYWAQRLLGEARARQGRFDEALPLLRRAVTAQPEEPGAYYPLGDVLAAVGNTMDAIAAFERYLSLTPDGPRADEVRRRLAELQAKATE